MSARIALTIAGSDSGGGAGIQADLKTFSALGVYGASAITALTAQNTRGVQGVFAPPAAFVVEQIDSVFADLRPHAVKIGMIGGSEAIEAVADALTRHAPAHVVLDPVMVAKGGDRLLPADAVDALRSRLVPLASVVTPNLPEAAALLGVETIDDRAAMPSIAARLQGLGARNVLLKGGHLASETSPDFLLHGGEHYWLEGARVDTANTHGTGCTLSSAIAALLARGTPLPEAARRAKQWLTAAITAADRLEIGSGHGPVHHFHALWREAEA